MTFIALSFCPSVEESNLGVLHPNTNNGRLWQRVLRAAAVPSPDFRTICPRYVDEKALFMKPAAYRKAHGRETTPKCGDLGFPVPASMAFWRAADADLASLRPKCVLALGPIPTWNLLHEPLSKVRGTVVWSHKLGCKVVPTVSLDSTFADFSMRHTLVRDLRKAEAESHFPEIRLTERLISIVERPAELASLLRAYNWADPALPPVAVDVETSSRQITSIAIAPDPTRAIVAPMWDKTKPDFSYWSAEDEVEIWLMLWEIFRQQRPKVFHNAAFDLCYFCEMLLKFCGVVHDTMFMSHSLQPELEKSLGHLGSIYCNERAWKYLHGQRKVDIEKKED